MKNNIKRSMALFTVTGLSACMLSGCIGYVGNDDSETNNNYSESDYDSGTAYSGEDIAESTKEIDYETVNTYVSSLEEPDRLKPVTVEQYADEDAISHAEDNDSMEDMKWLIDYCVNKIEPQVVEMLLSIPVFGKAAEEGLISKYVTLGLTYNDVNEFAAMTQSIYMEKNGAQMADDDLSSCYNIGHRILINTDIFDKGTQNDPEKIKELQDTLLHEMTHAFMTDYVRNAMNGTLKDGSWGSIEDRFPMWFMEGTAITVQNGYADTRKDLLEALGLEENATIEERLEYLANPEEMYDRITYSTDTFKEYDREYYDHFFDEDMRITDITSNYNVYSISYHSTMFTYYMAAKSMGLEPFNENGTLDMDAIRQGFGCILDMLHDGYSFDEIFSEISKDPETGEAAYESCADFEKKFMYSPDDPGTIFFQKFVYDYESRITDSSEYLPGGSIVPGINNYVESFMDDEYHSAPSYYDIIYFPAATPHSEWYAISSVRPSDTALGGNVNVSYRGETLSADEVAERDTLYIGDEIKLVDSFVSESYTSSDQWASLTYEDSYKEAEDASELLQDISSLELEVGLSGSSEDDENGIIFMLFKGPDGTDYALIDFGGDDRHFGTYYATEPDSEEHGADSIRIMLFDGSYVDYYSNDDDPFIIDNYGIKYNLTEISEDESREYLDYVY